MDIGKLLQEADDINARHGVKTEHARRWRLMQMEALTRHKAVIARQEITGTKAAMYQALHPDPFANAALQEANRRLELSEIARKARLNVPEILAQATTELAVKQERKQRLNDDAARMRRVKAAQAQRAECNQKSRN